MSKTQKPQSYTFLAWFVCILAAGFYCYEYLLRVAPSVMINPMMQAYGVGAGSFAVMSAAYYYIYTPLQLPVGLLMDRFGPRRLLLMAMIPCIAGSFLIGHVMSLYAGAFSRMLMGFGSAFAFVGVLKLAVHWLPPSRLALITGFTTALGMGGAIGGATILNEIVNHVGWRESWYIAGVVGIGLVTVMWFFVRDYPPHQHAVKREAKSFKEVWKHLLAMIMNPQFIMNGTIGGLMFLPLTVFGDLWGVRFLQEAYHMSYRTAGAAISMLFLGVAISSPLMGWFSDHIRRRRVLLVCGSFICTILFSTVIFFRDLSTPVVIALLFGTGLAIGARIVVFAVGCELSSPKAAGTSVALTNFLVMLGAAVFQPLAGVMLDIFWNHKISHGVRVYSYEDFQLALCIIPVGLLLSFFLSLFLRETHCKSQYVETTEESLQTKTSARQRIKRREEITSHS